MKNRTSARRFLIFLYVTSLILASFTARAEIVVDIPNVIGDSKIAGFENKILATRASGNFEKGGCGEFLVEKDLDRASPILIRDTVEGAIYPELKIIYLKLGEGPIQQFLTLTLTNAIINRVSTGGDEDIPPTEVVALDAESIMVEFVPFDQANNVGAPIATMVECGKTDKK